MIENPHCKRDLETITAAINNALPQLPNDTAYCVLLIGSWSLNLGTPTSDIDLLLVSEQRMGDRAELQAFQRQAALTLGWVQIEIISCEEFGRLMAKAQLPTYTSLSSRTLELIYKYACPRVLHGEDVFQQLTRQFSLEDFSRRIADYYLSRSLNVYQDVLGARLSEDHRSAVIAARDLVGLAVDALLALRGDAYPKPKWRLKRAVRLELPPALMEAIDHCLVGGPGSASNPWQWVERALILFRQLHALANFPSASSLPFPASNAPVIGNPWAFIVKANGKWLITHQDRFFEADEQDITMLFGLAMGLSENQAIALAEDTREHNHSTASAGTSMQFLERIGAL